VAVVSDCGDFKRGSGFRQARFDEPLLCDLRGGFHKERIFPVAEKRCGGYLPGEVLRSSPPDIPDLDEATVVRHYTRLSEMNWGVDSGFYPLGSCTMKYNPRVSEAVASLSHARDVHPLQDPSTVQGSLWVMYELQEALKEITGMDAVCLQPAAGAHGEFTGLMIIRAYHLSRGDKGRVDVLVPDTAHGTNFASAAMAGFNVVVVPSDEDGCVDVNALKAALSEKTAALMLTNPNTLGVFEKNIVEIAEMVHDAGALLYYDGANLNAIMGKTTPGALGFDVVHVNLHKTFSTPHGGGGPGAGPVGVKSFLEEFLPVPTVVRNEDGVFSLFYDRPRSIGPVKSFYGNFLVLLKALVYIKMMGGDGLTRAAERAVLNSNYLAHRIKRFLSIPFGRLWKHEFVASAKPLGEKGVSALDVAKRLLDYGFHAPTIYFPHLVEEALMIEPTETETKETLDSFAETLEKIINEPAEVLHGAPYNTSVRRVDEALAARSMIFRWHDLGALDG